MSWELEPLFKHSPTTHMPLCICSRAVANPTNLLGALLKESKSKCRRKKHIRSWKFVSPSAHIQSRLLASKTSQYLLDDWICSLIDLDSDLQLNTHGHIFTHTNRRHRLPHQKKGDFKNCFWRKRAIWGVKSTLQHCCTRPFMSKRNSFEVEQDDRIKGREWGESLSSLLVACQNLCKERGHFFVLSISFFCCSKK